MAQAQNSIDLDGINIFPDYLRLSHNTQEIIRNELLDTNTVHLIAWANALSDDDLKSTRIGFDSRFPAIGLQLIQINRDDKAFAILGKQLQNYVRLRREGHSRDFLLMGITNHDKYLTNANSDIRAISAALPMIPVDQLKKHGSRSVIKKAGVEVVLT